MFAVIKTGGKQYKVAKDDVLRVEKLPVEAGGTVNFQSVMMVGDGSSVSVGAPYVAGATVTAEVVEQTRGDKIIVFKKKRRKNYRRRRGHRQDLTVLRITEILTDGKAPSEAKAKPKAKKKAKPKDTASESKAAEPAKSDAEAAAAEAQATEAQASKPQASKPQAAESQATGDAASETGDSKE